MHTKTHITCISSLHWTLDEGDQTCSAFAFLCTSTKHCTLTAMFAHPSLTRSNSQCSTYIYRIMALLWAAWWCCNMWLCSIHTSTDKQLFCEKARTRLFCETARTKLEFMLNRKCGHQAKNKCNNESEASGWILGTSAWMLSFLCESPLGGWSPRLNSCILNSWMKGEIQSDR